MIEAIQALSATEALAPQGAAASGGVAAPGFTEALDRAFGAVNQDVAVAESSLQQLASGQPVEIHDVMIALEKARIGVQTMIQVRNRMVEAYQDLMRMQI